uniref:Aromatic-L-amino-acid decarboxylase n=1 Tax=Dugesia japonica TaxID=6161 RepID=A6P658_DUGJA|nr:aromatic amino acid decarboxylase [Dugesia japonica]
MTSKEFLLKQISQMNTNINNELSSEEVSIILSKNGFPCEYIKKFWETFETNKDGNISKDEFTKRLANQHPQQRRIEMWEAVFKGFDKNNSGKLSGKELQDVLQQNNYDKETLERFIKQHDKDWDGQLNYIEFLQFESLNNIDCSQTSINRIYQKDKIMDVEEFRKRGKEMIDFVANYLDNIEDLKVFPQIEPGYLHKMIPTDAPKNPEDWNSIMNDVNNIIMPGITHWRHPHFYAYFPTVNSNTSLCGDILSGGIGCVGFSWETSPACTELEVMMMDWLAKMLKLPNEFLSESGIGGGVIYNSCGEATLVALFAARNKTIDEKCKENPKENQFIVMSKLVGYYSDQAHSTVERAGLLSMIKMRPVKSIKRKMRDSVLEEMIQEDIANGCYPFYCVATLGTTGSCAFDNLEEIGPICKKYNIWLHVDAAYAGSAMICPEYRHLLNGIEFAMSFVFNPHKWMLVNLDCCAVWFKDSRFVVDAFAVFPPYLGNQHENKYPDFRHWGIQFSRRFRSLKIWFVLRLYGVKGIQKYIRNHIELGHLFERLISRDDRFEIVEEVTMGLVCFRLKGKNENTNNLYKRIEADGRIYMITSVFCDTDIVYLRFIVCYQFATEDHIKFAYDTIIHITNEMNLCLGAQTDK